MPAERFYVDADLKAGETVALEGAELHHLAHVMRVREGEEVELVNGRNQLARARVFAVEKKRALLEVSACQEREGRPSGVVLALPFLRLSKLEWVLEKGTELGADAFWLFPADFSEKEDFSAHQMERLRHVAVAAMKQCGRLDLPPIRRVDRFEEIFSGPEIHLYGDVREHAPSIGELGTGSFVFITGPERGFSERELKILEKKAKGVRLHRNVLRAETAPLAALVLLGSKNGVLGRI